MKFYYVLTTALLFFLSISIAQAQHDVADWERAKAFTQEYLDAMPADEYGLKPTPEIRSFAEQMLHMADANYGIGASAFGLDMPYERGHFEKMEDKSKASVTKAVLGSYDFVIDNLKKTSDTKLDETINLFGQFEVTRAVALDKAFEHQTHHRGQTTPYLRMGGVTPPPEKLF